MIFLAPVIVKYMEENIDSAKPLDGKHILSVP